MHVLMFKVQLSLVFCSSLCLVTSDGDSLSCQCVWLCPITVRTILICKCARSSCPMVGAELKPVACAGFVAQKVSITWRIILEAFWERGSLGA